MNHSVYASFVPKPPLFMINWLKDKVGNAALMEVMHRLPKMDFYSPQMI